MNPRIPGSFRNDKWREPVDPGPDSELLEPTEQKLSRLSEFPNAMPKSFTPDGEFLYEKQRLQLRTRIGTFLERWNLTGQKQEQRADIGVKWTCYSAVPNSRNSWNSEIAGFD